MEPDLKALCRKLGYDFKETQLLEIALTHRSAAKKHNERFEFLGDSLINHIIAAALFELFPKAKEGELSRLRAGLVRGETLAELAREFSLGHYIKLGFGEKRSGGANRTSILADTLEAIAGAIYLDRGMEVCRERVLAWYEKRLANVSFKDDIKDPKTRLQEYTQAKQLPLPEYAVKNIQGKSHAQIFNVECKVQGLPYVTASTGQTRRKAEQAAAKKYLALLIKIKGI